MSGSTPLRSDPAGQKEFRYAENAAPKPAEVAQELTRTTNLGPVHLRGSLVTSVHADRITGSTCEVDGDTATGTITFDVPTMYAGSVDYVAKREGGQWVLREFRLPTYGITTTLDDDGLWKIAK